VPGKEAGGEENVIVIEIGLKQIVLISLITAVLFLAGVLLLNYLKPRMNLKAEFHPNNTVIVSGRLMDGFNPVPSKYVAVEVRDQNNIVVWIDAVKTSVDGYFETVFALSENASGRFEVYANSEIVSERTSFQISR